MQMKPTSTPRRVSPKKKIRIPKLDYKPVRIGLEGGGCPLGTVPIRRTVKDELITAKFHSEMHASKVNPLDVAGLPGVHVSYNFFART